jgi:hypothetical protein
VARIALIWGGDGSDGDVRLVAVIKHGPLNFFRLSINGIDRTSLLYGAGFPRRMDVALDPGVEAFSFVLAAADIGKATIRLSAWDGAFRPVQSQPLAIKFKRTDPMRPGGGPARALLHGASVTRKPTGALNWKQKAADKLSDRKKAKPAKDVHALCKWLQGKNKPPAAGAGSNAREAQGRAAAAAAQARMSEAISVTIGEIELAEMVLKNMPLVGRIMAGVGAGMSVAKSLSKLWSAHKIASFRATLVGIPAAHGRRHTVHAATDGFERYELMLSAAHAARALAKGAELAIRMVPGPSVAVGAAFNAASVLFLVLKNFEDGERARKATEMLRTADASQLPSDYYQAIRTGHVAILCHVLNGCTEEQVLDLDPRSRIIREGIVPIEGRFARARAAIAKIGKPATYEDRPGKAQKAVAALKAKAADTSEGLRYRVTPPN